MDVTPQELRSSEIKDSWRGYDRDEVDDLLERAAVTIESLTQKLQELPAARAAAQAAPAAAAWREVPLPSSRDDADMLQRTLLLAQRAADDAVNEAQARARQMLDESEAKAQSLVSEAEATARRIAEGERRRLEDEILDLSARREQLARRRRRARRVRDGLPRAPPRRDRGRPREPHRRGRAARAAARDPRRRRCPRRAAPVAIADARRRARRSMPRPTKRCTRCSPTSRRGTRVPTRARSARSTRRPRRRSVFAAEASASPSPVAAPPRPTSAESAPPAGEWPPPAPAPEASTSAPPADSSWLPSEDDWAPGAPAWDAPAPWERDTAAHEPFASDTPIEANAVDTDSLDDDAFFASLREAVRDDAPLGPRRRRAEASFFDDRVRAGPSAVPPAALDASALHPLQIAPTTGSPSTSTRVTPSVTPTAPTAELDGEHLARDPVAVQVRGGFDPTGRAEAHADAIGDVEAPWPCAGR